MAMAMAREMASRCLAVDEVISTTNLKEDVHEDSGDETTPTTVSECSDIGADTELESVAKDHVAEAADSADIAEEHDYVVPQLGPGLFPDANDSEEDDFSRQAGAPCEEHPALAPMAAYPLPNDGHEANDSCNAAAAENVGSPEVQSAQFTKEETLFVFDWDDTVLPSSWIQRQGLRLDEGSIVNEWQREELNAAAAAAAETLRLSKQYGTVVLVTNAERGWIELSCQKFIPSLLPIIENMKIVSARTTYESEDCVQPLDWKVRAFEAEIERACGAETLEDPSMRKNIFSLGDSIHEREALMRATSTMPNCRAKSLKFVERPAVSQIIKQHELITGCFDQVLHHDGNLDLCISCN